jgi:predicted nucleic acid-binding protein
MCVVVADTTPIRYLTAIGHLDLLPRLFETIFVPSVVYEELQNPATPQMVRVALKPPPAWLKVVSAEVTDDPVLLALDEGERAALTLALSLGADLILLDERKGAARRGTRGFRLREH